MACLMLAAPVLAQSETATETPAPSATWTETATWTPTATWTSTATWTPTATWTATPTWTATWTPIVQTVVVTVPPIIIMPTLPPILPTQPAPTVVMPTNPPLPTAQPAPTQLTPFYGWQRYQSIHFIAVVGEWPIRGDVRASAGQFGISTEVGATARYPFTGDGLRLRYRAHPQGCDFVLVVDGVQLATLSSRAEVDEWRLTEPYFLSRGYHVFDLRSLSTRDDSCSLAFDFVEVFLNPPMPESSEPLSLAGLPPTSVPQDVKRVVVLGAPPTSAPTLTPLPPSVLELTLEIAYDANANQRIDLGEGVRGVSVRVVNALSRELLASGQTDERGIATFQLLSESDCISRGIC